MTAVVVTNNASTTISAAITAAATSIPLAAGSGGLFPSLATGQVFYGKLTQGNTTEIVEVTARVTDTLTVSRGIDGSTPAAFNSGAVFALVMTASAYNSYQPSFSTGYSNVTSSRVLATNYSNTTGRWIYASVNLSVTAAGILSVTVAGTVIQSKTLAVGNANTEFLVPPGATYQVSNTGTMSLSSWFEM